MFLSFFSHTSYGKHSVLGYGVQEANTIDVHEVTSQGYFLVFINDTLGEIWYYDRIHIMNLVVDCFSLQICHTGFIYVLSHTNIFSQNYDIFQDVVMNYMQNSLYWLDGYVMESYLKTYLFTSRVVYFYYFHPLVVWGSVNHSP